MSVDVGELLEDAASDGADADVAAVADVELSPAVAEFVDRYDDVVGTRSAFVWKWGYSLFPSFRLPTVPDEYAARTRDAKTLAAMYMTLADDLLEQDRDRATFAEVAKVPFDRFDPRPDRPDADADVVAFASDLWDAVDARLADAPARESFARVLGYDLLQTLNAVEYSALVNEHPSLATLRELVLYETNNMMFYPYADVDLHFSPAVPAGALATIRRAVWHGQRTARIGNWVTTWQRELHEGDYSNGPMVYALERGLVDVSCLDEADPADLVDVVHDHDIESVFLAQWADQYDRLADVVVAAEHVDLAPYREGMVTVFRYQFASKGRK